MLTYGGVVTGVPSQNYPNPADEFHKVYSAPLIISSTVDSFAVLKCFNFPELSFGRAPHAFDQPASSTFARFGRDMTVAFCGLLLQLLDRHRF